MILLSNPSWFFTCFLVSCRLEAVVGDIPVLRSSWYVNGIEIHPTERTKIVKEGKTLVLIIISVKPEDAGEYTLKVENELGETTCKTTLVMKGEI